MSLICTRKNCRKIPSRGFACSEIKGKHADGKVPSLDKQCLLEEKHVGKDCLQNYNPADEIKKP